MPEAEAWRCIIEYLGVNSVSPATIICKVGMHSCFVGVDSNQVVCGVVVTSGYGSVKAVIRETHIQFENGGRHINNG